MNFDNHLFRVSALTHILAGLVSVDKLYYEAKEQETELSGKVDKFRSDYSFFVNKETKTASKKLEQLNKASEKLDEITALKNIYHQNFGKVQISEGCKTHLLDVFNSIRFNRVGTKEIKNKYTEKGLANEEIGISIYSSVKGRFLEKCVERKDDGYIMGEIDVPDNKIIVDIKCSWDVITFGRAIKFIDKPEQCPYYPNMQGYMELWEKDVSKVCYILTDTPKNIIESEKKRMLYDFIGTEEMYEEACKELEYNLKFEDIEKEKKVIEVTIKRDQEYINKIKPTVIACREYLNNLKETYYEVD